MDKEQIVQDVEKTLKDNKIELLSNYMQNSPAVYTRGRKVVAQVGGIPNITVLELLAQHCRCNMDDINMYPGHEVVLDTGLTYDDVSYIVVELPIKREVD